MAKMTGSVLFLLLLGLILALAVLSDAAQKQPQKQRPRPGAQANANVSNKNKRPKQPNKKKQQQKETVDPKFFTKKLPMLGNVRGRTQYTDWTGKTIMQFLDLPYGKVSQRFKSAELAGAWKGLLKAHRHHAGCPSIQDLLKFAKLEEAGFDVEDCLRLTINTKSLEGSAPVIVYIHGDFFYDGDTVEAAPGYLLEQDVVLVSVRYRLGPFGFLSTLSEQMPGNLAVTDIILALRWIQDHIRSFGGDPSRVTLFGQVGGAALVNVLTLSPAVPAGLFHRVIYSSGTALSPAFITDSPLSATKDVARIAGCKQLNKLDALHKCLNRLNSTMLLAAFSVYGDKKSTLSGGAFGGVQLVIGGPSGILPEHPGRLLAVEKFKAYPTLGGSVKNGGTFMLRDIFTEIFNDTILDDKFTGKQYIDKIIEQANGVDPTGAWSQFAKEEIFSVEDIKNGSFKRLTPGFIDLCSTIALKNPVLLVLQANAKKLPNSTYLYTFDYEGELNRYGTNADEAVDVPFDMGASLTDENLYLFPWPRFQMVNSNRDIKIARRMVALWTSFAAKGVPEAPGVPKWPPMKDETGPFIKIGRTVSFGDNYLEEYNIAVREARQGYNLVNDDFYEVEAAINEGNALNQSGSASNAAESTDDEDDEEDAGEDVPNEPRGQHLVFIAKKSTRIQMPQMAYF